MTPHLRLVISERCNLRCVYCHVTRSSERGGGLMKAGLANKSLETFAHAASSLGHTQGDLSLYGGEPLLNKPALFAVLSALPRLESDHGFRFQPFLNTNGTLLKRDLAEVLVARGVNFNVSLDGPSERLNANRVTKGGSSVFSRVTKSLELLSALGARFQINSVVTQKNIVHLEALIDLAHSLGCRQMFVGLPDGDLDWVEPELVAGRLLTIQARARNVGVALTGPWDVVSREELDDSPWPPLNVVVRPDGRCFLPHSPGRTLPVLESVFTRPLPSELARLGDEWESELDRCRECELRQSCRGYLKMMFRYHTGSLDGVEVECDTARAVSSARESELFAPIRASRDLDISSSGEDVALSNPLADGPQLSISRDIVDLLDWFLTGGTISSAKTAFEAEELEEVIRLLLNHRVLVFQGQDTDRELIDSWAPPELQELQDDFLFASSTEKGLELLRDYAPWLHEAVSQLPECLKPRDEPFCIFGAPDTSTMADCLGCRPEDAWLSWMAGTVFHSTVVLNLSLITRARIFGGKAWVDLVKRGLVHELVHLAIRHNGICVPLWLEEGLCEMISGAPLELTRLAAARQFLGRFCELVVDASTEGARTVHPMTNLLSLSGRPVDENPAYVLAHDLLGFVVSKVGGLDRTVALLQSWGVEGRENPFPEKGRLESGIPFKEGLKGMLQQWTRDLDRRLVNHESPVEEGAFRCFVHQGKGLIFHRILGGYQILEEGEMAAPPSGMIPWPMTHLPERRIRHLRLSIHGDCNLRCRYCYEGKKPRKAMSFEVADMAVSLWRDHLRPGDQDLASVRFFGGEPLMNWPLIDHVLKTAASGWPGEGPRWLLNTNGTLFERHHVDRLAQEGERMRVGLSVDGVGVVNDSTRRFADGRGTFQTIDRSARMLAEARVPFDLVVVIGKHNINCLGDLVDYALGLRDTFDNPMGLLLEPQIDRAGFGGGAQQLLEVHTAVVQRCWREELPIDGKLFTAFHAMLDPRGAYGHFCSVTGAELSVGPSGELLLCHAVPGSQYGWLIDAHRSGRVPFPDEVIRRAAPDLPECNGCEIEGLCGGGCVAQAVATSGNVSGNPGAEFCSLMRGAFWELIRMKLARNDMPAYGVRDGRDVVRSLEASP